MLQAIEIRGRCIRCRDEPGLLSLTLRARGEDIEVKVARDPRERRIPLGIQHGTPISLLELGDQIVIRIEDGRPIRIRRVGVPKDD